MRRGRPGTGRAPTAHERPTSEQSAPRRPGSEVARGPIALACSYTLLGSEASRSPMRPLRSPTRASLDGEYEAIRGDHPGAAALRTMPTWRVRRKDRNCASQPIAEYRPLPHPHALAPPGCGRTHTNTLDPHSRRPLPRPLPSRSPRNALRARDVSTSGRVREHTRVSRHPPSRSLGDGSIPFVSEHASTYDPTTRALSHGTG